ncbi:uncharacterized protein IWZ02DRAFT_197561 [Phyllosticta citriasiana]|uniref:uncharacterized protein n=1 Tax=Phyllosticta citriasiana TaxID=595635 RepID=UPI0030FD2776
MASGTPRGRSPHLLGLGANSDGCRGAPRGRQRRRFSIAMLIFIINADHRLRRRGGTFLRKTNRGPAAPPLPASIALPNCYHNTYLPRNSISNRRLFIRQSPSWWPSCRGTGPAKACISFHQADKISESLCNDNLPMSGSRLGWFSDISDKFGRWRHGWAKFMAWKLQDKKTRTYWIEFQTQDILTRRRQKKSSCSARAMCWDLLCHPTRQPCHVLGLACSIQL